MKRLVIRSPNWLGDAIMALPAMRALRVRFADAHLAIAAIPSVAPLFEERTSAGQDSIVTLGDPKTESAALAAGAFEAIVLLTNSFRTAMASRRAAIPERWGYAAGMRRFLLTRAIARPRPRVHQADYYLELVKGLGVPEAEALPVVSVLPATASRTAALFAEHGIARDARCVGFAPGAAYGHAKRWPPRLVAETIVRLSREAGVRCLLFGASGDRESGREIESSLPSDVRAVNLIGRTDLRVLTGAIDRCASFVSNDSGAMHLAAAIGVPVVAIFGPTDERATSPRAGNLASPPDVLTHPVFCRPCMLRECPIDHRCMKGITVDAVVSAVMRQLGAAARADDPADRDDVRTEVVT